MPEPTDSAGEAQLHHLQQQLTELVLATPGVTRIEPTLRKTIKSLAHSVTGDGVVLTRHEQRVDIAIDISTDDAHQARAVGEQLLTAVSAVLDATPLTAGTIEISVLAIGTSDVTAAPAGL